ncbi:glycosyltransferase family A protein [uncultured Cedecea sp.]|uniref:glycosyltransferase family A protein n=1 Tax=uncultured Cedecea sp. TaxID=988762 RepID=UPI002636D87C|nr:glycosyltransferase family A protein [uncultured Cedecea sp.]
MVIPVYNKEIFVIRCLQSVLLQKTKPREIIIVNDGSTDNSLNVINDFFIKTNTDIEIIILDIENGGVSNARNMGAKKSKSDYIAFLDADDEWSQDYLFEMTQLIQKYPNAGVFSCNHMINRKGSDIFTAISYMDEGFSGPVDYFYSAQKQSIINSSKVIVNKNIFFSVNGFPKGVRYGEDLHTWIKLALVSEVIFTNQALVTINQFPDESRNSRSDVVLYPLIVVSSYEYKNNKELKKYLLTLFKRGYLFRIKEGNIKSAFKTLTHSFKISPIHVFLYIPCLFIPASLMRIAYNISKKGR